MNDKEKYNVALERAKVAYKDEDRHLKASLERIFPELKDSEDERIRKELIAHFRNTRCVTEEGAEKIAQWVAWLENQCKQKSTTWSKDDEKQLNDIIELLPNLPIRHTWLKSLKDRIQHQLHSPQEWSEADEKMRKWIIDDIRYNINNEPLNNSEYKKKAEKAIAWLEEQGHMLDVDKVIE